MAPQNRKSWARTTTCKEGSWIPGLKSPKFSCCQCSHCATVLADTAHWTSLRKPPLRSPVTIGDRVAVKQRSGGRDGEEARVRMGVVKYVGDLNSPYTSEPVFIGVKLDDPVGEHDGMFCGKRFFSCPEGHGLIVPATEVQLLATNDGRQKRVGPPNSMVLGSERERVGPLARRERGLESMLSKPWARNRISALSGAESCRVRDTPTPNGSSLASSRPAQAAMSEKTRKGAAIGGAPANSYSNEGDMFVEDVERDTGSPAVGRRAWRSVPIMRHN
ncbi:CAP-Gly domain-containing linker protein 3 [Geodia barretti]|uniref:CAP-Gly domain-containing linker protein 3 n=1 Tax=Geodia barretti TaxID=519541 RepID=A0AA35WZW7_GEOBA|nr:CAP-Gly domain-containing linker protein 3 [Geodia barretti]